MSDVTNQLNEKADADDFADEVARTKQNAALMALLDERSKTGKRVSLEEARQRLGID